MRNIACVVGIVASLISARASADASKAWAAAKDNLPATTQFVAVIDVAAVFKSPLYAKAVEALKAADGDIQRGLALVQTACGADPFSMVDGIVVAGNHDKEVVAAYIQLTVDRTKASACLESMVKVKAKDKTVTIKQDGAYTVVSAGGDRRGTAYFPWVAPNVVMVTSSPDDKTVVDGWFNQKDFAKSKVAALAGKLDAKAVAAGALALDKVMDSWVPVISGYGNWTVAAGKLTGVVVATAADAKAAKGLADDMTKELKRGIGKDRTPASVKAIARTITVTASGAQLTIKGSATEKDLGDALGEAFMKKKDDAAGSVDMDKALARLDDFSKAMCQCKDKACADKVNNDMTKWGQDMAKSAAAAAKPNEAQMKRATDITTRYAECMTKLMSPPARKN